MLQFHDEYKKALKHSKGEAYSLWEAAERFFLRQPKQVPSLLRTFNDVIFGQSEVDFHESKSPSRKVELSQAEVQFLRDLMKLHLVDSSDYISKLKILKNHYWLLADKTKPETELFFGHFSANRNAIKKEQKRKRTLENIQRKLRKMLAQ